MCERRGRAHGNHKSGDVEAEAFLCLTHVVQASFLRVSGKQGRKKGDVRERKRGKWKSKRGKWRKATGLLWLLLPFALEADLCEIVAAFLQTPLPKKEREVDVGEKKRRKEGRKERGSWLVWKEMNTKHSLYQLGSAPFLPPFSSAPLLPLVPA